MSEVKGREVERRNLMNGRRKGIRAGCVTQLQKEGRRGGEGKDDGVKGTRRRKGIL